MGLGVHPPGEPVFFHDPEADDLRTIDVATDGPEYREHQLQYIGERRGEDLRLAYVGLTRARHQTVVWWAGSEDAANSPLGRLLFARDHGRQRGGLRQAHAERRERDRALPGAGRRVRRADRASNARSWGGTASGSRRWSSPAGCGHAEFDRRLDWCWRRTSYTDITAGAYEAEVSSEPDETLVGDEPDAESPAAAGVETAPRGAAPSLLAQMPAGAEIGTLVHRVLAATDFAAADLDRALEQQINAAQSWRAVDLGERAGVVAGLRAAIETPLGPMLGGVRLQDIARLDRLDEFEFELPLVGGDEPTGALTLGLIADVLREHLIDDDPLIGYADRLTDEALRQSVHGYLTGSLDLVLRLQGDGAPRFAVVDYKTNWLAGPDEDLTLWHHRPEALVDEMLRRHYALQALLYTVALHRYLRWRLSDYDPDRDIAGVLYLFLRGMAGPATPTVHRTPYGVFAWRPSGALVEALSDALDRGVVAA